MSAKKILFIDIEASALEFGYPIEIGWSDVAGNADGVLIRPHPSWASLIWSQDSEAVHGITQADLWREGLSAEDAYACFAAAAAGASLFSDAPSYDERWLWQLVKAANGSCFPRIESIRTLWGSIAVAHNMSLKKASQILQETENALPVPHRAAADASRLSEITLALRQAGS